MKVCFSPYYNQPFSHLDCRLTGKITKLPMPAIFHYLTGQLQLYSDTRHIHYNRSNASEVLL